MAQIGTYLLATLGTNLCHLAGRVTDSIHIRRTSPNLVFAAHHESVTPRHSYNMWKLVTPLTMQYVGPPPLPVRRRGQNRSPSV